MHAAVGVAQRAVIGGLAPAVVRVDTLPGTYIEMVDRLDQTLWIDLTLHRKFGEGWSLLEETTHPK